MTSVMLVPRPLRTNVRQALSWLGSRYPGGLGWLDAKLDQVESGRAQLWLLHTDLQQIGYALITRKGTETIKLSTLYLVPAARKRGLGQAFLTALKHQWLSDGFSSVHVTVPENDFGTRGFFERNAFALLPDGRKRYGDRFDATYRWSIDEDRVYFPS